MKKFISLLIIVSIIMCSSVTVNADAQETKIKPAYIQYIEEICDEYGVCPEFIEAMIEAESNGNPKSHSKYNAQGLMQIIPKWNKDRMKRLGVTNLYDPRSNILVGVDLVTELFEKYDDVYTILMCYNEGEYSGAIKRAEAGKYSKYAMKIVKRSEELERLHGL